MTKFEISGPRALPIVFIVGCLPRTWFDALMDFRGAAEQMIWLLVRVFVMSAKALTALRRLEMTLLDPSLKDELREAAASWEADLKRCEKLEAVLIEIAGSTTSPIPKDFLCIMAQEAVKHRINLAVPNDILAEAV